MIPLIFALLLVSTEAARKPTIASDAIRTFRGMRRVYLDMGIAPGDIDSRIDIFVKNYIRFVELGDIEGKTYESRLNSVELLSDDELELMFGLVPVFKDAAERTVKPADYYTDEELVLKYGADVVTEARLVFAGLRPRFPLHGINRDTERSHYVQFVEKYSDYSKLGKLTGEGPLERLESAVKSKDVIDMLGGASSEIDRKFYLNEESGGKLASDHVYPSSKRARPVEEVSEADDLGHFLKKENYDTPVETNCAALIKNKDISVNKECLSGKTGPCKGQTLERRCMYNSEQIPDQFEDWDTLGYIRSLLHYRSGTVMPGGWAVAATQILDLYQQIYSKQVTTQRNDLSDLFHIMNCVYKTNGLARGSPMAAFQFMSDRVVVPKFNSGAGGIPDNCRDASAACADNSYKTFIDEALVHSSGSTFYKYLYLWEKTRKGQTNEFCFSAESYEPTNAATPAVSFMSGKAYVQFADTSVSKAWVTSTNGNSYETVRGEKIVKPLLYKKGPLGVMMVACYEMFFTSDGIFNLDCSQSTRRYLPQWVLLASYGPGWFGTVMPKLYSPKTYGVTYPTTMKISRQHEYMFKWDSFVLPRVDPYSNTGLCENGGITLVGDSCYCPKAKYGKKCERDCLLSCKNGSQLSHYECRCQCPKGFYGLQCGKKCDCGENGRCDSLGNCICHRQVSWGPKCENQCHCKNGGYCHTDGRCECLAGYAGTTCTDACTKTCVAPSVCWYSNSLTTSGHTMHAFCACPFGFFGEGCKLRVKCEVPDTLSSGKCAEIVNRNRCNTDEAIAGCPNICGHCYLFNTATDVDT